MIEPKFKIGQKVTFAQPPIGIEEFEQNWFGMSMDDFSGSYLVEGYDIWESQSNPSEIFYKLEDFYKLAGMTFSEKLLKAAE